MQMKDLLIVIVAFLFVTFNLNGKNFNPILLQNQNYQNDTIGSDLTNYIIEQAFLKIDSLENVIDIYSDSIAEFQQMVESDSMFSNSMLLRADSLKQACDHWELTADSIETKYNELTEVNVDLNNKITELRQEISRQKELIEDQKEQLKEKDATIKQKEELYNLAVLDSKIGLVTLEGKLSAKEQETSGRIREIELLRESVQEKQRDIDRKDEEISKLSSRYEENKRTIDSLRDTLSMAQQSYIKVDQERKYAKLEAAELRARLASRDKREKQVAVVQGVALRTYRTPLYMLAPKDISNYESYEITNENAGSVEFDLVTGATVRLVKLSKEEARYTTDFGWFIGFGGKNLFKNFYFGPNIKIFDFLHINAGVNIAEFRVLKKGFSEGDVLPLGVSIPTVNQWKFNAYFTLSFDFELITQVAGKLK